MARPNLRLVKREHTLLYGLRLVKDEVWPEQEHPRFRVTRADGAEETIVLHAITGDVAEIKRRLLESVDAFFELQGDDIA